MNKKDLYFFGIAIFVMVIDQLTKFVVRKYVPIGEEITLIPHVFSITYVKNTGALFGLFKDSTTTIAMISVIVMGGVIILEKSINLPLKEIYLGLILGGIGGNFIDRVFLKYVTDFLYLHHWPVFNIADASIDIGLALFIFTYLKYGE